MTLLVGNQEFKGHKNILASRSPVFAAMFEHDLKEKRENRVEIADIDSDVFKELLNYIYTGTVQSMDQFALDFLAASDKVSLPDYSVN